MVIKLLNCPGFLHSAVPWQNTITMMVKHTATAVPSTFCSIYYNQKVARFKLIMGCQGPCMLLGHAGLSKILNLEY